MKIILIAALIFCQIATAQKAKPVFADSIQSFVFSLSKIMIHDVVNPPAASRYYAYAMLGAYEIVSQNDEKIIKLSTLLKNYPGIKLSAQKNVYDTHIAALYCILETGMQMLPSGFMLKNDENKFIRSLKKNGIPQKVIDKSIAVAKQITEGVIAYSKTDNYNKLSAKLRYTPLKGDQYWYPTPPAYIEAVEPNWRIIRTMIIDSCNQFKPGAAVAFSKDTSSNFYRMAKEVYDISKEKKQVNADIASFWDCNPFAVSTAGHMSIGFKKISPGGHWMNIAGIAAKKAKLNFEQSVMLHAFVAFTLQDAFISCWDEKYRSNRIRPETYINRYIDIKWEPLLQTPPFPEYTSGHSVISTASAEVLTYMLGDNFLFTDNTEVMFEIPERSFTSFRQAAEEAAISRLYGGIHFRDAIVNGQEEGKALGKYIVEKLKSAGIGLQK